MRGHVQGMWSCGSNLCITARGRDPQVGQLRNVVAVNQVMRDSWVTWLKSKEFLQNRGGTLPIDKVFVVAWFGGQQRKGIERGSLVIIRIRRVNLLHRVRICFCPSVMIKFVWIAVESANRCDVSTLTCSYLFLLR